MTLYWACTNLTTLPDPTKSVEDQDTKLLDILKFVGDTISKDLEGG